jgi:hypothetical protein
VSEASYMHDLAMPAKPMSTRSGAGAGDSGSSRVNGTTRVPPRKRLKVSHDTEDEIQIERLALIEGKQAELKGVLSRHDDLVRLPQSDSVFHD